MEVNLLMIPNPEVEAFTHAVRAAVGLAATGKVSAGYRHLRNCLSRAEQMHGGGVQYGDELVRRYHAALSRYRMSYGVRWD